MYFWHWHKAQTMRRQLCLCTKSNRGRNRGRNRRISLWWLNWEDFFPPLETLWQNAIREKSLACLTDQATIRFRRNAKEFLGLYLCLVLQDYSHILELCFAGARTHSRTLCWMAQTQSLVCFLEGSRIKGVNAHTVYIFIENPNFIECKSTSW